VITGEARRAAPQTRRQRPPPVPKRPRRPLPPRPGRPRRETLAWAAGAAVAALALFTCYLRQSRTVAVGSDGASQALQAWDMLHGNLLLHGWWVTDVSFYTTELPQYAAIELARGLSADVMHVAGAMTYTLLVLAAALLARGRATGRAGAARALLAAGIMLAPQLGAGTQTLVLSPDHTGTAVPILLIWLLIERAPARWWVPALVWLGLAWTAVADAMTLFVAVIPLAGVCALRAAAGALGHGRARRRARGAFGNRGHRARRNPAPPRRLGYDLALLAAAVLAIPAEAAATALIRALGGWQAHGLATALGGAGRLADSARLAGQGVLLLFGADVFGATAPLAVAFALVHLIGVALAAVAVVAAARRLRPRSGTADHTGRAHLVESVLLVGIVIDLAAYLLGVQAVNILSTREIAPVLPFAAVLAGRILGDRLAGRPLRRGTLRNALVAALALYTAMLGYGAAKPPAPPQYAGLAAWLPAHHLTNGLSGYHQANIVTLESGGRVTLRAVAPTARGRVRAYAWNASLRWFDPATHSADFLVLTASGLPDAAGGSGITAAEAAATFGHPAEVLRYHSYTILIWPRGENLLVRLRQSSSHR
jgi:hypothetical protein